MAASNKTAGPEQGEFSPDFLFYFSLFFFRADPILPGQ